MRVVLSLVRFGDFFLATPGRWEEKQMGLGYQMLGCFLHLSAWQGAGAEQGLMETVHPKLGAAASKGVFFATWIPFVWGNPITAGSLYLPRAFYAAFCSKCLF